LNVSEAAAVTHKTLVIVKSDNKRFLLNSVQNLVLLDSLIYFGFPH